jgi:hypothetical protein
MNVKHLAVAGLALSVLSVSGCRVSTDKNGDNENVSVATPFGGVKVKTNDATGIEGIGLPVYPGSELVKKKDNGSADVNLSFGKFQLRVKAASYRTPDDPDKVNDFYRNALKKYGVVIACRHDQPVGTPTRTDEGLTCSDNDKKHVDAKIDTTSDSKIELKAGSKQHQHIVAVEPEGNGTKFGLVSLDLPISFSGDGEPTARQ